MDVLSPHGLLNTKRGKEWIDLFLPEDRDVAIKMVNSLTLVSHSQFERAVQLNLEKEVSSNEGPFAFFAVREINPDESYFKQVANPSTGEIDSLSSGSDHGSEARIASLIRNYCKTASDELLNHPSMEKMRASKCRTIIFVDDFIGSGERTKEFIDSFCADATIASWKSLAYIKIIVVAYSGVDHGIKIVEKHKSKKRKNIKTKVVIERDCPTFNNMPWEKKDLKKIHRVCKKYGFKTSKGYWWDGYGRAMAAMVFEHGCPDNAPVILWAASEHGKPWKPLFPDRVILGDVKSIFPPEITRPDSVAILLGVGQKKLAHAGSLSRRGDIGKSILIVLALIAKGKRKRATLSYSTGLSKVKCTRIIEACIKWKFITQSLQITDKGIAELGAARSFMDKKTKIPDKGEECYYPSMLRKAIRD